MYQKSIWKVALKLLAKLHTGGLLDVCVGVDQHIRAGMVIPQVVLYQTVTVVCDQSLRSNFFAQRSEPIL